MNTSFTISILGLLVLAALGVKGLDVSGAVVTLVGAYCTHGSGYLLNTTAQYSNFIATRIG